ncbi:hypothetical protein DM860_015262 [Cuscuta australis]|uniref:SET domain-containing protein n=1 Tax=Cuscuta australis TaxID=267555 RepID=A0A328D3B4_9ASTE|nr:hypothetical protein DM860_015262 [Cuscuta australis]
MHFSKKWSQIFVEALPSPPPSTMPTASLTAPSASLISLSPQISLPIKSPPLSFVTAPLTALPSTLPSTSLRHSPAIMDTSGLCLSLCLLRRFQILCLVSGNDGVLDRTGGLMTNHEELLMMVDTREDVVTNEVFERIKEGSRAMAFARRMLSNLNSESPLAGDCDLEEAVLCFVLTNAVEVQDSAGRSVGVAVYGPSFSWNNHGCSPNCSCRFSTMPCSIFASPWCIHPKYTDGDGGNGSEHINTSSNFKFLSSLGSEKECGPRLFVRSIKDIKKGEELLITYTDLLQPKVVSRSCDKCSLHKQDLNVEFQEIINLTPNVWHILAEGGFLKLVKDPIDFKWIGSTELSVLAPPIHVADSSEMKSNAETEGAGLQALTM